MMPHEDPNVPKCFENVCRFCLGEEHCVPLFISSLVNDCLMDAIDLLILKVDENDGLPNAICECCYRIMVDYARFEARAIESYRLLGAAVLNRKPSDGVETGNADVSKDSSLSTDDIELRSDTETNETDRVPSAENNDGEEKREDAYDPVEEPNRTTTDKYCSERTARSYKKCPVCGKVVSQLSKHMPVHSEAKKYRCEFCDKRFTYDTSLRKHLNIHRDIRKYHCQYCEQCFCDRSSLRYHEAKHRDERKFSCPDCSVTFYTASQLKQHTYLSHRERSFRCELCSRMFHMKHHLEDHMIAHTDERPHGCPKCKKTFKRRRHLLLHMATHESIE